MSLYSDTIMDSAKVLDASEDAMQKKIASAFFDYNRKLRIERLKIACLLMSVLMPFGSSLDYFDYPKYLGNR